MDPKKINCEFCSSVLDNPCRLLNCNHVVCNHHIELSLNNDFYKCPINDCLIQNYNFEKEPIEEIKLYKELNCLYHRNAWSLYCKNCNLVLCQSCILDHPPSHHIVGIGDQKFLEKAQKDKSKIDILLENSKDSLDSRTKLFEKKIEQYNELESTIDLYMEGLQTSFLNTIGLLRNHIKQDIKTKCLEATTKFNNLKKIQNSILGTSGTLSPKPTGIPDDLSKVRQYQDSLNSYQQLGQTTTIAEYHIHGYLSEFENVFKQINQNIIIPIENRRQDTVVLPISISNLQTTHQKDIYVERFNNNINPTILSKLDYKIDNPIQSFSTLHLQGSIGIGKTSALLNFGLYCLEKSLFKYIFYIRCGDFYLKDLKTILLNYFFVDEEELRDEACVKQQFKNINHESTLLLFDNTLYNVLLLNDLMFFEQNGIKMIIASRLDQNSKDLDTSKNKLVLEPFTIPESIQLMKSCLNRDFPNHQLEEISKLLHFNPQKIKEECLILNSKSGLSMNEYIDNLKNELIIYDKNIFNEKGQAIRGYTRNPNLIYNVKNLKKTGEVDSYIITCEQFFLLIKVSFGYLHSKMYELLYIDLTSESKTDFWAYDSEYYDEIRYTPFIRETIHQSGDFANLNKQGFHLNISIDNNNNGIIKHILDVENLKLKLKIHAILNLSPSRESIVLVSQINNQLYYSCNTNTIPISGNILIGGKHFDASKCFGVMRFFRGITNSVKYIVWFTGNGRINGKPLGINIGQGLGNVDSLTENGVCVDGIIHKLGQVEIEKVSEFIWYLKNKRFGNEGKLMFTLLRKVEQENHFIKFTRVVGKFNGRFILDSGIEINILNLVGYMHISKND